MSYPYDSQASEEAELFKIKSEAADSVAAAVEDTRRCLGPPGVRGGHKIKYDPPKWGGAPSGLPHEL